MTTQKTKKSASATCCVSIESWGGDEYRNSGISLPPNQTFTLIIDYPLDHPARINIKTGKDGMDGLDLINRIVKEYHKVYEEEEESEDEDGKYGIYGHDIGDLCLEGINVNFVKKTIGLEVGS